MSTAPHHRPASYLQSRALPDILRDLAEQDSPSILTEDGEPRAVLQDIKAWEEMQETLALLKILARGDQQFEEGKTVSKKKVFARIRAKRGRA